MKEKKDNKGRNNINKKDHQLKAVSMVDKANTNKKSNNSDANTLK
jgi:hypothetical protein